MLAMLMGLSTLVGFEAAANLAEEAKDPHRTSRYRLASRGRAVLPGYPDVRPEVPLDRARRDPSYCGPELRICHDTDYSVCNRRNISILYRNSLRTMKLDDWLTRLVAVPPGRSPLANGLAIGMRIALFILIPLGIIAAIAIVLLHR